jgi:predicted short-subunit dehydrogenase-like oxidoreductase (DUF2520 family)
MGQVPAFDRYLIIGSGRAALHLSEYFRLEGLPFDRWWRAAADAPSATPSGIARSESHRALEKLASRASHIVVAISDRAIEPFLRERGELFCGKAIVHLSGALCSDLAASAHPLMTFAGDPYPLATYRSIWFALEKGRGSLSRLLPGLSNNAFELASADKPLYHAWCAMSGNFTAMLWSAFFERLQGRFGAPPEAALPYLRQQAANIESLGSQAVTGPLARGDRETVAKHLASLRDDPWREAYAGFAAAFAEANGETQSIPRFIEGGAR